MTIHPRISKCLYKNIFMHYYECSYDDIRSPLSMYGSGFTSLSAQGGTLHSCDSYKL